MDSEKIYDKIKDCEFITLPDTKISSVDRNSLIDCILRNDTGIKKLTYLDGIHKLLGIYMETNMLKHVNS